MNGEDGLCSRHLARGCQSCGREDRELALALLQQAEGALLAGARAAAGTSPALAASYMSAASSLGEIRQALLEGTPEGGEVDMAGDLHAACSLLEDLDPALAHAVREAFGPALAEFALLVTDIAEGISRELPEGWE